MKETTKHTLHKYTFIFWLIVPVLLAWLGINYVIGTIETKPQWSNQPIGTTVSQLQVTPFIPHYQAVKKTGHGMVTFWFDDAWDSQYLAAAPILERNGFKGAIAVATGFVGVESYANWAQLRTLQNDGWEITNHTVKHNCEMEQWDQAKIDAELTQATHDLWANKLASDIFVSPCGVDSETLRKSIDSQFLAFRGVEPGTNDLHNLDQYNLFVRNVTNESTPAELEAWVNEAEQQDVWVILVFHQVGADEKGDGERFSVKTENFTQLVDYVKKSGLQVVLPSQAFQIAKELK